MRIKKSLLLLITLLFGIYIISQCSAVVIDSISTNPKEIEPGKAIDLSLSLKNNEAEDIEEVLVSLDLTNLPFAPYNYGTDYSVDEIRGGRTKDIEFKLISFDESEPGTYKIPITITYKSNDVVKTQKSFIGIKITSKPVIDLSTESGLLLKNQRNTITVKIINKGLSNVKFSEVEIQNSRYYDILSQKKVYIGDIDSNDFQTVDFQIYVYDSSLNNLNIPIILSYKDVTNQEYNESYNLNLKAYGIKQAQDMGLTPKSNIVYIVIIILIIIIIFIIYRVVRKRRKRDE